MYPKLVLALCASFAAVELSAQTFVDDFSTSNNWTLGPTLGSGVFAISNGNAHYSAQPATKDDRSVLFYKTAVFSSTASFQAQIDVHLGIAVPPEQFASAALAVLRTGDTVVFNQNPALYDYALAGQSRGGSEGTSFGESYSIAGKGEFDTVSIASSSNDFSLRIAFDAQTKELSGYYDSNGAIGGYTWSLISTVDLDGAQNWGLKPTDTFTFALYSDSGGDPAATGPVVSPTSITFDNFVASVGPSISAVPEPSTYGWGSLAMLAMLAISRRNRKSRNMSSQ